MKALLFIARGNLKKKKGDVVVLGVLITLATLLFYTSMSVFFGLDVVLDEAYYRAESADFLYMDNVAEEEIAQIMMSQEAVVEYEASECLYLLNVDYRKEGTQDKSQTMFFLGRIEEERKIGKLVWDENVDIQKNSILLPYYMKAAEDYKVGDICYFTIGEREYKFEVAGFTEDPLFATPLNITTYGAYISDEQYEELVKEEPAATAARCVQHKVRLKAGEDSFAFDQKITPLITKVVGKPSNTMSLGVSWSSMKGGVAVMSKISMAIILVFSILLIFVVLIVMRFSIRNYIEMNLKNIGILQSAGYTPGQLNFVVVLEMGIITGVSVLLGLLLGTAGSNFIGTFEGIMLGLKWRQSFHLGAACMTACVVLAVVPGVAFLCGKIYKKITVLESLRGGIRTHNFKKNYFGFDKSRLPVSLILAGKSIVCEKARTISVFIIVMILAFSSCAGFSMYENFAKSNRNLLKIIGSEAGDAILSGENMEQIGEEMEAWSEIEKILYYANCSVELESKKTETSVVCDIWEQPELMENEMIVRGRLPRYENEIVLTTKIAEILNVDVGDTIYVTGQGEQMDYIVCGVDQKINNMGLRSLMTRDAAIRLNGSCSIMFLYIYANDNTSYETISEKILNTYSDIKISDSSKLIENSMSSVSMAFVAICLVFVCITIFVVVLVEVLLVKSKVVRERKNIGLNKAFGYTTRQLIVHTMLMNIPVVAVGAIVGVVMITYFMEPLVVICLSFCGIEKFPLTVNLIWMAVTVTGILLVAMVSSFLSSIKVRKIEPVRMLSD